MRTAKVKIGTIAVGVQGNHSISWYRDGNRSLRGACFRVLPCVSVSYYRGVDRNFSFRVDVCWLLLEGAFFVERAEGCVF